jgi:hypothetical protein
MLAFFKDGGAGCKADDFHILWRPDTSVLWRKDVQNPISLKNPAAIAALNLTAILT